ncbi:Hypothetical protein ETEE_0550 [Edwardsiella anguillarum ET080813]|uniref:Uncharacterized protein n=1 Tax=Edwardsiella anguillarum ET080813 TaxID=667120 RepID=A0A076LMW0_9GAMM|nr:Hypothetical protein ETEE_0550 [Edwardsiella anguillarum ET080813]
MSARSASNSHASTGFSEFSIGEPPDWYISDFARKNKS